MSNSNKSKQSSHLLKGILNIFKTLSFGAIKVKEAPVDFWLTILFTLTFLGTTLIGDTNFIHNFMGAVFGKPLPLYFKLFFSMSNLGQHLTLSIFLFLGISLFYGFREFEKERKLQLAIDRSGLRSSIGEIPLIIEKREPDVNKTEIIVEAMGVSLSEFEAKKGRLTSGFRKKVEKIEHDTDMGKIVITLSNKTLPKLVKFEDLYPYITKENSFIVGQSINGPIVQNIQELPHLLISGTTGGGKSVFFRSTILSLLKSSPHIQLYLLDLKRGVEVKEFCDLPNVRTVKNKVEATLVLGDIVKEMNRRYIHLEKKGYKTICPKRDKMDLIVVGIDEAASLFKKEKGNQSRAHIEELGRLARASGIHLIPSTQKPVKNAIDTDTLDNLPGRMTFRMVSHAASNAAIGSNIAKKIPAIKGRAVWTNGADPTEVQAPFISDKKVKEEIELLGIEFENKKRTNFQEMLSISESGSFQDVKVKGNEKVASNS